MRKLHFSLITLVLVVTVFSWYMLGIDCNNVKCLYDKKISFYAPLYHASKWLSLIMFFLIFASPDVFKKWLFYIASPTILLTIFLVSNISIYSDGVIKLSRTDMSQLGMQGLAIVTAVFLLIEKYLHKRRP